MSVKDKSWAIETMKRIRGSVTAVELAAAAGRTVVAAQHGIQNGLVTGCIEVAGKVKRVGKGGRSPCVYRLTLKGQRSRQGVCAELTVEAVRELGGHVTTKELAEHLGVSFWATRQRLRRAVEAGLVHKGPEHRPIFSLVEVDELEQPERDAPTVVASALRTRLRGEIDLETAWMRVARRSAAEAAA